MKQSFFKCGTIGLCMEVCWTGLHALQSGDLRFLGHSSILMFPIYGMAAVIRPVSKHLQKYPRALRGGIYTAGIFFTEYTTGSILRLFHMCPWDYSSAPYNIRGLIRLDYAPLWFLAGLFFEKILSD